VRNNIAFGLQMRKLSRAEVARRTDEAIRLVQLQEHAGKLPGQMSGGQQQRVAIARAVVLEPSLVLMDEPLSNLDAKLRLEMRTEIRRLHQSLGLTTVYVTHDQEEALSLADRLVVLRKGKVQQIGTPEELHTRPANWHVADFMGFRNLFALKVADIAAGPAATGAPGGSGGTVVVEGPGLRLTATPCGELSRGDDVVVGVRPEDLVVGAAAAGIDGGNRIAAIVEVVEYQGRELAAEARTPQGQRLHIRTAERLAPGDRIQITVRAQHLLAYPQGSEALPEMPKLVADPPTHRVEEDRVLAGSVGNGS
jgi:putative spermidine/putrescine transport system ATP-binding protein